MKTEFLIYRPGVMLPEIQTIDIPEEPTFAEVKSALAPMLNLQGNIDRVVVDFRNEVHEMFVDDRGPFNDLPVNDAATLIYHEAMRRSGNPPFIDRPRPIRGIAVICLRKIWMFRKSI